MNAKFSFKAHLQTTSFLILTFRARLAPKFAKCENPALMEAGMRIRIDLMDPDPACFLIADPDSDPGSGFDFCGSFLPSWIRIRIRNLNADSDPDADPDPDTDPQPWIEGSGSVKIFTNPEPRGQYSGSVTFWNITGSADPYL